MSICVTVTDLVQADAAWALLSRSELDHRWEIHLAGHGHLASISPSPAAPFSGRLARIHPTAGPAAS
jgi:hypothetical protein